MNRRRQSTKTLTGSRIYVRKGKFTYFSHESFLNQKTGKSTKWHVLCSVEEGEIRALTLKAQLLNHIKPITGTGTFGGHWDLWVKEQLEERRLKEPSDPERLKIWGKGTKSHESIWGVIRRSFEDMDVEVVRPKDVSTFLKQWFGQRVAQTYKAQLAKFFTWCCEEGVINSNPAREVKVKKPKARNTLMTDQQYILIKEHLLIGKDKKPTRSGEMVGLYMDLLYLFFQRGTDVRLLKWDEVGGNGVGVTFTPTKTEDSSGTKVHVPLFNGLEQVLQRLKKIRKARSEYVIHTEHGSPYSAKGIQSLFKRACDRAGVSGVTLKDIRSKAATDAINQGYSEEDLKVMLAHEDISTTRGYIKSRQTPVSRVDISVPKKKAE